MNDKQLTKNCGILDLFEVGDAIMADKGFLISDLTTPRGIHLIILLSRIQVSKCLGVMLLGHVKLHV